MTESSAGVTEEIPWHATAVADVEESLATSPHGLTAEDAEARFMRYGPNRIREQPPPRAIVVFLRQFSSTFILILVVAAVVTLALGELLDTALIAIALLLNAVIGFHEERRAADAVQALMQLVVPHCRVVRDGQEWEIDSRDVVPGDVVLLESGSRVPADIRLSAVNSLTIDESLLTGESLPVTKTTAPVQKNAGAADRHSMAFTGTIVANGRGRGYVVATGDDTELGSIAGSIRTEEAGELPLQARMAKFAQIIGVSVVVAAIVAFVSGVLLGESVSQMFRVAVAMAVSAVPEGLPVAMTVTFAIGVTRMARRNAVLRRLPALETLGSTTVVGSDKTGTLTENRMTVPAVWAGGRNYDAPELRGAGPTVEMLLTTGVLTNEADLVKTAQGPVTTGDPTEVALLVAADRAGIDPGELRDSHRVVAEIPFESHRRYSATLREYGGGHAVFVKGAPERIISMCTAMNTDQGPVPLDPETAHKAVRELAARGMRVLGMAYRKLTAEAARSLAGDGDGPPGDYTDPDDLVLVGFQAMMDPPREGVREAIEDCHTAGVRVAMITGDHSITARAIAHALGILDEPDGRVLTGAEMRHLDDDALRDLVDDVSVYARVSPNDKLRIVRALQDRDHVVAVTGDGVNDAPALRAAAIGVSMGRSGTDVAREASDMVLSDDNFVSIVSAVEEGRIAFANIRKVAFFLISTAVAETAAIMVSVWLGWPLLLVPAQILWLNLVTNGVQDLALAFEPGSRDVLKRPPRPRREGILSAMMWERTVLVGTVMAAGALYMFHWQLGRDDSLIAAHSVALTTLVIYNVFQAGNARAENRSLFTITPWGNPFLFWATLGAIGLHVSALYFPPTQFVLGVEPISAEAWVRAIAVAVSVLVVVEAHKWVRRRWPLGTSHVHWD
ncbi:HAD-IC family P-type ATPase [Mycolicibacterium sp. XJ2546]